MDEIHIHGGHALEGTISISGSKNAALPLLALSVAVPGKTTIENVPNLKDTGHMLDILTTMGAQVDRSEDVVSIDASNVTETKAPYDYVRKMRASVVLLGPLLARYRKAQVSLPGGCAIGVRPIDLHLKAFEAMGVKVEIVGGDVIATLEQSKSGEFMFDRVTVTGTINAMILAASLPHEFSLENCAMEPEVEILARTLVQMGAKIEGIGSPSMSIQGCSSFASVQVRNLPDRIETGTYLAAAMITGGKLALEKTQPEHCKSFLAKMEQMGASIAIQGDQIVLEAPKTLQSVDLRTDPYPGFPTDMQAQLMAVLCLAQGKSVITETIFENRFMHVPELNRMGASISIKGASAYVEGVKELKGAPVMATDLRASACLVLAGLAAKGVTKVLRVYHLDRGYENLTQKFLALGAKIERVG
ncbi:MAG: UDP-N-acetylglucosamine 1-carboxyvinyltransferase [Bdellovibrionales bacterium]|nr:UDP-N-acetylglucosamine 1-carboxyvinyltransferase [Bdellovibrionales bacterium]